MSKKGNKSAAQTTKTKNPLTKVVVKYTDSGEWIQPNTGDKFYINEKAEFPDINFEIKTDNENDKKWEWEITWAAATSGLSEKKRGKVVQNFKEAGKFEQKEKIWNAKNIDKIIGGTLTVKTTVDDVLFKRTVHIVGKKPEIADIKKYLVSKNANALDKIINQESHYKHFIDADGEPVVAFDKGYGITQLTKPAPSYSQVWSWIQNIDAAVILVEEKKKAAISYLSSKGKNSYTDDMVELETLARWNGGSYHVWVDKDKNWIRNPNILCDDSQGNTGWNISKEENKDKTVAELKKRDKDVKKKAGGAEWFYTGVCYADHLSK